MNEITLLGGLILYGILFFFLLWIARFMLSIPDHLRHQRIIIHLLSGIAQKLDVDDSYFDHTNL